MELNIEELEYDDNFDNTFGFNQDDNRLSFEEIPENNVPIKVVKKSVRIEEPIKPINQAIPKENARMIRPKMPNPSPKISYEAILSKMGMFVSEGKLHLLDDVKQSQDFKRQYNQQQSQYNQQQSQYQNKQVQIQQNVPENSYIYNKYFKEEMHPIDNVRRPKTKNEYKKMLLEDILQRERINQIKSKRLIMPTSNINIASGNSRNLQNKLFTFPKR